MFGGEAARLRRELGAVAAGRAFLLQAGDCAESFAELTTPAVHDRLRVILQMAIVLTYGSGSHIVKLARMAGQFAKPRSAATEESTASSCPSTAATSSTGSSRTRRAASPTRGAC